ncbi:hypothetical protein ACQ4PT_014410 [Festuca glaucescens]
MVAELQMIIGGDTADLLCFSSQTGEWVSKDVPYPLPPRPLSPDGVVSFSGRLWWVDLSWCLLTCDPYADALVLTVVPLPEGKALEYGEAGGLLDKYRCVGVSGGKLRFVDMYRNRNTSGSAQISVWTLADPDSTEWTLEYEATFAEICNDASFKAAGLTRKIPVLALIHPTNLDVIYFFLDEHMVGVDVRARKVVECEVYELVEPPRKHISVWTLADPDSTEWTLEYEATFAEICNDASFKAAGLPRKIPVLALIHPTNPDVLYFFLDEHMVGVDVRARKVVECEVYELVEPPREHVSSRFVHAWQLPRALCSGNTTLPSL